MCVCVFVNRILRARDFKAGWDLISYLSPSFQTLLRYTPIKRPWLKTEYLTSECAAAYELFSKDNAEQLLGIAELDLVLRSLGQVNYCFHLIYGWTTSNSKTEFFRAPAHYFWAQHSNVETAVLLVACFRTTTHSKWASLCELTLY